jgi:Fic family protein
MQGVRGEKFNPGKFRTTQNWIGPRGSTMESATYVPPSPLRLGDHLNNFQAYLGFSKDAVDPLVQTALIHAQFEMIHPFDDGNGRIGRLLIPLYLARRGCLVFPSLYMSGYLERNRDEYYDRLNLVSTANNWIGWIEFFLEAIVDQATSNMELVRAINRLYEDKKRQITDLVHTDQAIYMLDFFFDKPVFSSTDFKETLNFQRARSAKYLRQLVEAGFLRVVIPQSGRRPQMLAFDSLWEITDSQ